MSAPELESAWGALDAAAHVLGLRLVRDEDGCSAVASTENGDGLRLDCTVRLSSSASGPVVLARGEAAFIGAMLRAMREWRSR